MARRDPSATCLQADRLDAALRRANQEISTIRDRAATQIGENEARVFDAHILFLSDPALVDVARRPGRTLWT